MFFCFTSNKVVRLIRNCPIFSVNSFAEVHGVTWPNIQDLSIILWSQTVFYKFNLAFELTDS